MDFVVFSDDWGRHPTSCEHIFRRLLPDHRIVWVNTIGTRSPGLSLYDAGRAVEKLRSFVARPSAGGADSGHSNLTVLSPVMLPYNQYAWCRAFNRRAMRAALVPVLRERGFRDVVALSSLPNVADFLANLEARRKVYYCVDDFTAMPGVRPELMERMERETIAAADRLLYTARPLAAKFSGSGKPTAYLPHGVDFDHFQGTGRASLAREPAPPVIGFFGLFSRWIDVAMLTELARRRTEWTWLHVGNADVDVSELRALPNVIWTGPVSYASLPGYARWFDVGLIPFVRNRLTEAVNPLKLLEYLALGLPVAAVPLPEIREYGDLVHLGEGTDAFEEAIRAALADRSDAAAERRRETARRNSWSARAEALLRFLE